ncbi:hypothetical protein ACN38_g8840 [Penicillium nordicum]|uniref:Phenol hydroxylase-like C-terminal dimerisation domain-containing protein n=1 Tax=Penicillium nordicum TaxID=229535 RepID=A0A0M9WD37_9EURO|nr:hypothetical protein ACN38_g8840 [Penicillium nordicum]
MYHINGLAPEPTSTDNPASLLGTYQTERHEIAQQLIEFDRKFSSMFSGQMGATEGLTQEEFQQVFKLGNGFTNDDVKSKSPNPVTGTDYISGILRPGRRLLNVRLLRHADGWQRDIHDDIPSTGRFRILCLTSTDLLDRSSVSAQTLEAVTLLEAQFPKSIIEQIVLHPQLHRSFEWNDVPTCVKRQAEMRFYDGSALDDAYGIYGVDPARGALVVVRPDGYVGVVSCLGDVQKVDRYLRQCIRTVASN